jgi:hypothetical protein
VVSILAPDNRPMSKEAAINCCNNNLVSTRPSEVPDVASLEPIALPCIKLDSTHLELQHHSIRYELHSNNITSINPVFDLGRGIYGQISPKFEAFMALVASLATLR